MKNVAALKYMQTDLSKLITEMEALVRHSSEYEFCYPNPSLVLKDLKQIESRLDQVLADAFEDTPVAEKKTRSKK